MVVDAEREAPALSTTAVIGSESRYEVGDRILFPKIRGPTQRKIGHRSPKSRRRVP